MADNIANVTTTEIAFHTLLFRGESPNSEIGKSVSNGKMLFFFHSIAGNVDVVLKLVDSDECEIHRSLNALTSTRNHTMPILDQAFVGMGTIIVMQNELVLRHVPDVVFKSRASNLCISKI